MFSASLIGYVESRYDDEERKNSLLQPVPHPAHTADYLLGTVVTLQNMGNCMKALPLWMLRSRLSLLHYIGPLHMIKMTLKQSKYQSKANANIQKLLAAEFPDMAL